MRKKSLLFLLTFTLAAVGAFSQNLVHKVEFGFSAQPQLSQLKIKDGTFYNSTNQFSFLLSGDLYYHLNPRLKLRSGLEWQAAQLNLRDESLMFPMDVVDGMWVRGNSYYDYGFSYGFLGIPLHLILQLGSLDKKNSFFLEGGLSIRYKLNQSGQFYLNESGHKYPEEGIADEDLPDTPGTWLFGHISFGYNLPLGKLNLHINPTFEYSPTTIHYEKQSIGAIDGHPIFFGLNIGVSGI